MTLTSVELRNRFPDLSVRYQNDVDLLSFWLNLPATERRRLTLNWSRNRPRSLRNNNRQSQRNNLVIRHVPENYDHIQGEIFPITLPRGPEYSARSLDQLVGTTITLKKQDYKSKILSIIPFLCSVPHSSLDVKYNELAPAVIAIHILQTEGESLRIGNTREPGNVRNKMEELQNLMVTQLPTLMVPFTSHKFDIRQPSFVVERNPFISQVNFRQLILSAVYNFRNLEPISMNWLLMILKSGLHGFLTNRDLPTDEILLQTNLEFESIINLSLEELKCVFKKDIWCLSCSNGFADHTSAISHVRTKHDGFISPERRAEEHDRRTENIINDVVAQNNFEVELEHEVLNNDIQEKNQLIFQFKTFLDTLSAQNNQNPDITREISRLLHVTNNIIL